MNTTPLTGLELRPLVVPADASELETPAGHDFIRMMDVRNRVYFEISGHHDEAMTAAELLPHYQPNPDEIRYMWVAILDGKFVGRAGIDIPLEDGSKTAFWQIELLRKSWGKGVGSAAYELLENKAREHGRTVLQSWASHPAAAGTEQIEPPTGFGSIPDDHAAQFYKRHGYSLEQVERNSAFDLRGSFDEVQRLLDEATAASEGYRVVQWAPPTPAEYVDGYAWMKSRMSTDAPSADLEFDEEVWDAERIARHDALWTDADQFVLVTAAQHLATGELCAFNELVVGKNRVEASHQEDTLVLKQHRGHKLGMLVKCAGLVKWRELVPDSPRVLTYNAEENRPMLDINEAIGFAPIAYGGAWKKVLQ